MTHDLDQIMNWHVVLRIDYPEKCNITRTFLFEFIASGILIGMWSISRILYEEIYLARLLGNQHMTFIGCKKWVEWEYIYKLITVVLTLF